MAKIQIGYPSAAVEQGILTRYVEGFEADRTGTYGVTPVVNAEGLEQLRQAVDAVRVETRITGYITAIVRATREAASLTLGASPRAGVSLFKAARAAALLDGRDYVIPDDVKLLAPAVLRHRVNVAPELELEGVTADQALKAILDRIEAPTRETCCRFWRSAPSSPRFLALWFVLGAVAGILWTPRALLVAGLLSLFGVLGFWTSWGLDVMLVADIALLVLIWLDATLAQTVVVAREPLPALAVGHTGEVTYRWTNPSRRRARLRVREVRPDILGGSQPPRPVSIPPRAATREVVPVVPLRRGRESAGTGGFVLDSLGPLGLGRHRFRLPLPWDVVVYPPLVSVRLRASVAEGAAAPRRRLEADSSAGGGPAVRVIARMGAGRRPAPHRLEGDRTPRQGDHAAVRSRAAPTGAAGARYGSAHDRRRRGRGSAARFRGPGGTGARLRRRASMTTTSAS